ncbi:MAG: nitronate monooxygenase [Isosphaeraceae bacterium]
MARIPRILTVATPGVLDPRLVVASARAGALGVLDPAPIGRGANWSLRETLERTSETLQRLGFGVRCDASELTPAVVTSWPANLGLVVVRNVGSALWSSALEPVRASGRTAMAEVTSREQAVSAVAAGFDTLMIVGQEAGGWVGAETTFILLQAVLSTVPSSVRVWARGGIGPAGAAACVAAGATGVVLDGVLALTRESALDATVRAQVTYWDGTETTLLGRPGGPRFRGYLPKGSPLLERFAERDLSSSSVVDELQGQVGWTTGAIWPLGADVSLASELAGRCVSVGGVIQAVEQEIDASLAAARDAVPLAPDGPLAESHATRYPIVQGPMTRVSDRVEFARAVADGGGLPMLALAMMRGVEVQTLLEQATKELAGRPWGVGILGFLPPEHRDEQVKAILEARPPFAIIAGGRPDQAHDFDQAGIVSYLHVPSPRLLAQFVRDGARRFVLEGRECGGHVGPRSSLILWEQAGEVLHDAINRGTPAEELHVLYAGGIHDARSSAAVAALSGRLASRGVKVGVLVGTGYLFTKEAVATGRDRVGLPGRGPALPVDSVARNRARPPGACEPHAVPRPI